VADVVKNLESQGAKVDVYDPWADKADAWHEYQIRLTPKLKPRSYDAVVAAVAHDEFKQLGVAGVRKLCKKSSVLYDIKYVFPRAQVDGRL
jgi:UDP-N-acetyl-D-galactosamine dehydrogenase